MGDRAARLAVEESGDVCLSVSDTGVGMDETTRARIFEPFFTTRESGTGLGLSTLQAGVTSLGGRVEVESAPGVGSTFRIFLPRTGPPPRVPAGATSPKQRRVLLAEDAPVLRRFLLRELEGRGWEPLGVGSVSELREKADSFNPHLALLDWNLAGEQVGEVARELRSRGVQVVILSGDPADVADVGVPVLGKPLDWRRLEEFLS